MLAGLTGRGRDGRFRKMCMFRIVGMGTTRHLTPDCPKPRIPQALQSNFGGVITDNRVVAHHLEKSASTLSSGFEFRFVSQLFQQAVLLLRSHIHELFPELGVASRVYPIE